MARGINVLLTLKDRFTAPLRNIANNTKDAQRQFKQANNTLNNFGNGFKTQINGLMSSVTMLGGALGAMSVGAFVFDGINTYKNFDQAMKNVAATAGLTASRTNEDYKRMEDAAREMGRKTSKTASEAANALNYMQLAGWSVNDSLTGLEPILRLSEASGMDLAQCSDAVTDSLAALSLGATDLPRYLDVVSRAQQKSNTTAGMLMEAYKSCGGVMSGLNVPLEESSTALGVLANRGIKAGEGGNSLSAIMLNLTSGTGAAGKKLEEIGVTAFDSNGKFIGLQATLLKLNEATKNMTEEQRNAAMAAIGGKEQVKSLNALMAGLTTTTADGRSEWNALSNELTNNANGSLQKMAQTMNDTLPGAMSRFRSAIEDAQLCLMDAFGPSLKNLLDDLAANLLPAVSNEFAYFGKEILPKIAEQMGIIVPLFAGVATSLASFAVIGKAVSAFKEFQKVSKGVSAAGGITKLFTVALGPVGLWALAIGAVIAVLLLLWNKCEGFRNFMKGLWEIIKNIGMQISEAFTPVLDKMRAKFEELSPKLSALAEAFSTFWTEYLVPFGAWLADVFAPIFVAVGVFIGGVLESLLETAGNIINGIITVFSGVIDFLTGVFSGDWSKAWEGIKNIFTGIIDIITNIFMGRIKSIGSGIAALIDKAKSAMSLSGSSGDKNDNNQSIPRDATGTAYFGGGLTSVNESGGEIVNLPSGTQIIPHDISKKMVTNNTSQPIKLEINIHGNMIGNQEFLNMCGEHITSRVVAALANK